MKIFYLQLQSSRHICPHTSIVDEKFLSTILKKAWWWCRPPWWGCWPSWWGCWPPWWWCRPPWGWWGPQKHCCGVLKDDCCTEGRPEIGNPKVWLTYQPTYQLTWVGARDTCVSKNWWNGEGSLPWLSSFAFTVPLLRQLHEGCRRS